MNLAVLCGSRSGGLVGIDFDDEALGLQFDTANPELLDTFRITGARGWKILLWIDGHFGCVANPGDRAHRQRIFALVGERSYREPKAPMAAVMRAGRWARGSAN